MTIQHTFQKITTYRILDAAIGKADIADAVVEIVPYELAGGFDNQTIDLVKLTKAGTVKRITFFTAAALGSGLGIDVIDGGADGTGTTVISSCTDNLSGKETKDPSSGNTLDAGDWIRVKFDDYATATFCSVVVEVEHKLNT